MVKQHDCTDTSVEHLATFGRPYHYVECGLPNVYLAGVRYWTCTVCGNQYAEIPAIKNLHRLIARALVCQAARLRGEEMRFLRKRLGKKSMDFAAIMAVAPETYSRWENRKQEPSLTIDHLVRLYYALNSDDQVLVGAARLGLDAVLREAKNKKKKPKISAAVQGNEWRTTPVAA